MASGIRKTIRVGAIVIAILGLICFGYLNRERTEQGRNCRICAMEYKHWKLFVFGAPVWSWDTEPKATEGTRDYFEKYLSHPHSHEWTGGGYARYGRNSVGCGRASYGPYPQHQLELTKMGFCLVAASGIQDPGARLRYFERIIFPSDLDHYFRVIKAFESISDQIPKEPWAAWYPYRVWSSDMEGIKIPDYVRAGGLSADEAMETGGKPADTVLAKLERIKIPKVAFKDTPIEEAMDFTRLRSSELDPDADPNRRGVSFLILTTKEPRPVEGGTAASISFEGVNVPLLELIKRIAVQAKLDAYVTSVGIILCPIGTSPFPNGKAADGEILRVISKAD